jgi:hypothetical protein
MTDTVVSAVFDDHVAAERAVADLRQAGVSNAALSFVARYDERHGDRGNTPVNRDGDHKGSAAVKGVMGGAAVGALLGIAALAIPGVGPLVAAGAIAASAVPEAAAIGAGAGAVAGGLGGLFRKHGVSDADARYYQPRISQGGIFISVDTGRTSLDADSVVDILYRHGGHNTMRPAAT